MFMNNSLFFFFEGITVYIKQTGCLIKNLLAPFGTLGGKECGWNLSLPQS
jgi:hypothetical protein